MSSIQGFRCGHCRAELLARPVITNLSGRSGWTPPVLKGSDLLASQVCLRLSTDRISDGCPVAEEAVTWAEIVERATREGLLNAEQASLLRCIPLTRPPTLREGSA